MKVMRAWDKGRNNIAYVYRDPDTGRTKIGETKFKWWFYVKKRDFEENKSLFYKLLDEKLITEFEPMHKYIKIFVDRYHNSELLTKDLEWCWEYKNWKLNHLLEKLKAFNIPTFEADLLPHKRWLLSDDVEIETDYRILVYDLETDDRDPKTSLIPGMNRILSIAVKDGDGKEGWLCLKDDTDEAECEMLKNFAKIMNGYDVFIGWNNSNFDDPFIKAAFMKYGIQVDFRKKFFQDALWNYKKYGPKLTSYSLDNVSKSLLKRGKVEHTGQTIYSMWKKNKALLKEYNMEDVRLVFDIENKSGYVGAHRDICIVGKCPVDDLYVTRKIDNFILKQAQDDNEYHFLTVERNYGEEKEALGFEGAYVFPSKAGRYRNVRVLDFASLYPSVIKTFNISPDTLIHPGDNIPEDQTITTPTRHRYRKDFIGILPKVVAMMKSKRDYYKGLMKKHTPGSTEHKMYDKMQYVYKSFGLSFYGAMGEKHTRFYDVRIAESITLGGQYVIKLCAGYLERNGFNIIAGSTDSVFVEGIKKSSHVPRINEALNKLCELHALKKFNADESALVMDYDKGFRTFYVGPVKLRYAGVLDYLDGHEITEFNLYVAGLEFKRTDTCELVRTEQRRMLELLLKDDEAPPKEQMRDLILELQNRTLANKLPIEMITFAQRITKPLEEYEGRQMHKMVALEMIGDNKEVWVGDKVPFYIISIGADKKPIPKPVYKFDGKYAAGYYWNNKIFPPLQRILQAVYPNIDWGSFKIKSGGREIKVGRTDLW